MPREQAKRLVQLAGSPIATVKQIGPAAQEFFDSIKNSTPAEAIDGMRILSRGIFSPNAEVAKFIALMCGALVERGASGEAMADAMLDRLAASTGLARRFFDACAAAVPPNELQEKFEAVSRNVSATKPIEYSGWQMLEAFFAPAIAMFSSDPEIRKRAGALVDDLSKLAMVHHGAHWLVRMLRVLDKEPFIAIEPATRLGIVGKMSGVSVNFQLSVLLMDQFPSSSTHRVSTEAASVARGEGPQASNEIIKGCWNLSNWKALRVDGTLPEAKDHSASNNWIWNEGVPLDIPVFEGFRVILLSPPSYARSWKSQRDFAQLPAELAINEYLNAAGVEKWLGRFIDGHNQ